MKHRWIITTPLANRSFQPRPKVASKKCNLVPPARPNRTKVFQPRNINVGPLPEATPQYWAATLGKTKDALGATTSLAPVQTSHPMDTPSTLSPTSPKVPTQFTEHPDIVWYVPHLEKHVQNNSLCHQIRMMMKKKKTKLKVETKIKIMRWRHLKPTQDSLWQLP